MKRLSIAVCFFCGLVLFPARINTLSNEELKLFDLIEKGKFESLKNFLENNKNINLKAKKDTSQLTPLISSLVFNQPTIANYLIENYKDAIGIDEQDSDGRTALHYTYLMLIELYGILAKNKKEEILEARKSLEDAGADQNLKDRLNKTPSDYNEELNLVDFVYNKNIEELKKLLEKNKDNKKFNINQIFYVETYLGLLETGIETTPLCYATNGINAGNKVIGSSDAIAKLLLQDPRLNVNVICKSSLKFPINTAIDNQKIDLVTLYVNHPRINLNLSGDRLLNGFPLHVAQFDVKNYDIVKVLLQNKDLNVNTLLRNASGVVDVFSIALPINQAIADNRVDVVTLYLDHPKINLAAKDYQGTPLQYAKKLRNNEIIQLIEEKEKSLIKNIDTFAEALKNIVKEHEV